MFDAEIIAAATRLLDLCKEKGFTLATAESCTGGLVAGAITAVAGSSDVLDRGFVTYSNAAKQDLLGVTDATLSTYGAVSRECAEEMAKGALAGAPVDLAVAITGIAGPGGATPGKPVGLVYFCAATRTGGLIAHERRYGAIGRDAVRCASVLEALAMMQDMAAQEARPHRR